MRFSAAWKSPFASGKLGVGDEVRQPRIDRRAEEAGREARDARERDDHPRSWSRTAAGRTPHSARRSDATISLRREKRSTNEPRSRPITIIGTKSATRSAATHLLECVRSQTSTISAMTASLVPRPDPTADRKSRRNSRARRRRSSWRRAPSGSPSHANTRRRRRFPAGVVTRVALERTRPRASSRKALSSGEPTVTRIGARSAEARERTDDHAFAQQRLEERSRVLLPALRVDEVRDCRGRRTRTRAARGSRETRVRSCALMRRRRSTSAVSSRLASAAACACELRSNARRTFAIAVTTFGEPTP